MRRKGVSSPRCFRLGCDALSLEQIGEENAARDDVGDERRSIGLGVPE
jgi:hypothetical protein